MGCGATRPDESAGPVDHDALAHESDLDKAPSTGSGVLLDTISSAVSPGSTAHPGSAADPFAVLTPAALSRVIEVHLCAPGSPVEVVRLDTPLVLIGRDAGCDLRLPDPGVSGRHVALVAAGDRYLAVDISGKNGLFLNSRSSAHGWFGPGDELRVGSFRLLYPPEAGVGPPTMAAGDLLSRHPKPPARLSLRLNRSGKTPIDAPLERPLTLLGRSPACKVRLSDQSVSNVHAALFLSPDGLLAVDLVSRQGLAVNGRTVRAVILQAGDQFRIGAVSLDVIDAGAAGRMPAVSPREALPPCRSGGPSPPPPAPMSAVDDAPIAVARVPRAGRQTSLENASGTSRGPAAIHPAVLALLRDETRWSAEFVREATDVLLPCPDEMIASELDRLVELSERLNRLRLERAAAGGLRSEPGIEVFDAEREHCRRTVLSLLGELAGRGVEC